MPTLALPQAGLLMMRFTASFCHIGSCLCMGTASYYHLLEQGGSRRCARRQMPKRPSSPPPRNLGYSPLQRDPNSMEDCLPSPSMVPGLCPPPCPSGQSARLQSTPRARSRAGPDGPVPATALKAMAGHTQGRRQGPGWPHLRTRECAPEQFAAASLTPGRPPQSGRVLRPARRARTRALLTAEGCAAAGVVGTGVTGAAGRAAIRSGLVPGRPAPSHSPAEPQRSRGGGAASPVPGAGWRSARPSGTGLGAPPAGNPLGQPWDEGAEPPCQDPAFTSGDLARLARRPDPLCQSRVGWPWLTSPSFVWKLI